MERFDLVGKPYASRDVFAYFLSARMAIDQPMQCHSNDFSPINYGTVVYKKDRRRISTTCATAWARSVSTAACKPTSKRGSSSIPAPDDLRTALETSTGEDLGWFFDGLVPTTDQTDYALTGAKVHWHVTAADHRQKQRRTRGAVVAARPARRWGVGGHRLVSRHCQGRSARSQRPGSTQRTELTTTA